MEFFTNKSIWTKIVIALVIVLLMEFIIAKPSLGAEQADALEFGGKLISPVVSLGVTLADAVQEIMQSSIMGVGNSLLHINTDSAWYEGLKWVLTAVLVAAVAVAFFMTAGLFTAVVGAVIATIAAKPIVMLGKAAVDSTVDGVRNSIVGYQENTVPGDFYLPVYSLSPEEIFQGKILLFNVDFFGKPKEIKPKEGKEEGSDEKSIEYYYYIDDDGKEVKTSPQDIGAQLSSTISKWYVSLRYIGIVVMMIVLLYVGIRMLISTVASDKAKYKQMLQDWAMGMVILFSIHYIMVFSNVMVNSLTKVVASSVEGTTYTAVVQDKGGKIKKFFDEQFGEGNDYIQNIDGKDTLVWPTNLMGKLRIGAQLASWGSEYIGLALCFIVLVMFTAFFVFTYLKRVIYMAFLTLMAPLVAVTYPIDKLNDGQAQGFNKWFKEYIFNLLIQPLHLLLYYILVTSAFELAGTNVIYSLVAIGFMIPAEKLLRTFFGFEKSATAPSALTGAALTTGMMQLMKPKAQKGAGGNGQKSIGGSSSSDDSGDAGKIDTKPTPDISPVAEVGAMALGKEALDNEARKLDDNASQEEKDVWEQLRQEEINAKQDKLDQERLDWGEKSAEFEPNRNKQLAESDANIAKKTIKPPASKMGMAGMKAKRYVRAKGAEMWAGAKQHGVGSTIRTVGKVGAALGKGIGTSAGAAMGFASGVAQGDLGKAIGGATAGAAVGSVLGGNIKAGTEKAAAITSDMQSKIASKHQVETAAEAGARVRNQYKELAQYEDMTKAKAEMKKRLKANGVTAKNNKEQYEQMMGTKEKEGLFEQLYSQGVTDSKSMIAAQQMLNDKDTNVNSVTEAVAVAKTSEKLAKDDKADGINREKYVKSRKDELMRKHGFSEQNADIAAEKSIDMNLDFNKRLKKIL